MNRRRFLKNTLAAAGAAAAASGLVSACGKKSSPQVALVACPDYTQARRALEQAWSLLAEKPAVRGRRVLLKPNLIDYQAGLSINTDVAVIEAAIVLLKNLGAGAITVGESSGNRRDSRWVLEKSGVGKMLERHGVPFVDLNYDRVKEVPLKTNYGDLGKLYLPQTVLEAEMLISLPKMKCHHWTGVTLAMKNMFGTVPGVVYGWPKNILHWRNLHRIIVDLNATLPSHLCLLDGVVGMEGNGPLHGPTKKSGLLLLSNNALAADVAGLLLMGFNPHRLGYIQHAFKAKLGEIELEKIKVAGEKIASLAKNYQPPPGFDLLTQ